MARYRWLQDGFSPGGYYFQAGDIASTVDVGGILPTNFVPSAALDPLDASAVAAMYAAGPQIMPILVRQQWSGVPVLPPVTYWRQIPGSRQWQLVGPLAQGYAPIGM
jgi:hypothetical protein